MTITNTRARLISAGPVLKAGIRLHTQVDAIEGCPVGCHYGDDGIGSTPNPRCWPKVPRHLLDELHVRAAASWQNGCIGQCKVSHETGWAPC